MSKWGGRGEGERCIAGLGLTVTVAKDGHLRVIRADPVDGRPVFTVVIEVVVPIVDAVFSIAKRKCRGVL